jgi:flagellar FliL protein
MAEKKAAGAEDESAASGSGSKKKLLIMVGAGIGVLVLGIVLGWLVLGGKGEDEGEEEAAAEEVHAPPALYVALGEKHQVPLAGGEGKSHFLVIAVTALTRDPAVAEELKFNAPLIRDRLGSLFARQQFDVLRTEEGKLALRAEVLGTVQGLVAEALAAASAGAEHGEEDEEKHSKSKKKKGGKKDAEDAHGEPAPGGVEQVFFTEFVLQ